jgi:hypothetical protein
LEIETLEPAANNNFQQHVKVRCHKDLVENFEKKCNEKGFPCSRIERGSCRESNRDQVGGVQLLKMQSIFILEGEGEWHGV